MAHRLSIFFTREAAQAQGLKHYFTRRPCKHGHLCKRYVSNGACFDCARGASSAYWWREKAEPWSPKPTPKPKPHTASTDYSYMTLAMREEWYRGIDAIRSGDRSLLVAKRSAPLKELGIIWQPTAIGKG